MAKTHCKNGHERTEENLRSYFWHGKLKTTCRICENDRRRGNPEHMAKHAMQQRQRAQKAIQKRYEAAWLSQQR